jgi:hypothetical protein
MSVLSRHGAAELLPKSLRLPCARWGYVKKEFVMRSKLVWSVAAVALLGVVAAGSSAVVRAQSAREAEMVGFHQLCDRGDRKACIRFGIMIGENRERHAEWRRAHPEFWWWER